VNSNIKTAVFWVVLLCVVVLLILVVKTGQGPKEEQISFTAFLEKVKNKEVHSVVITGNEVHGLYNPNLGLHTYIPANYPDVYNLLREKDVDIPSRTTVPGRGFPCWSTSRRLSCCLPSGFS